MTVDPRSDSTDGSPELEARMRAVVTFYDEHGEFIEIDSAVKVAAAAVAEAIEPYAELVEAAQSLVSAGEHAPDHWKRSRLTRLRAALAALGPVPEVDEEPDHA